VEDVKLCTRRNGDLNRLINEFAKDVTKDVAAERAMKSRERQRSQRRQKDDGDDVVDVDIAPADDDEESGDESEE